jgi:hypothetical protein
MSLQRHFWAMMAIVMLPALALAGGDAYPVDRPALVLHLSDNQTVQLTLQDLAKLPKRSLTVQDSPDSAPIVWTGVDADALFNSLNVQLPPFKRLRLEALNLYSALLPRSDIEQFHPIIAYSRDGQSVPVHESGPLFWIYPFDDYPELRTQIYYSRAVWQLSDIYFE